MDRKAIIDKVVKLLALSNNNPNQAEAESAKKMATKLMAQYDISVIEAKEKPTFENDKRYLKRKNHIPYDTNLINIISYFNGVSLLRGTGITAYYIYVGRKEDIQTNDYMMDIIFNQRKVEWTKFRKRIKESYGVAPSITEQKSWMDNFALGVDSKLQELTIEKEEQVQEYGLVPVKMADQALADYKKDNKTKEGRKRNIRYNGDGYEAGKNVSINKGIETQSKVHKLN